MNDENARKELLYFTKIRKDPLVKKLNSEEMIRRLFKDLLTYADHAMIITQDTRRGQADACNVTIRGMELSYQSTKNAQHKKEIEKWQRRKEVITRSLIPAHEDLEDITYTVGTFTDYSFFDEISKVPIIGGFFPKSNPLQEGVNCLLHKYDELKKRIQEGTKKRKGSTEDLDEIIEETLSFFQRGEVLFRLAKVASDIKIAYSDRKTYDLRVAFSQMGPETSLREMACEDPMLKYSRIDELAGYFTRQASKLFLAYKMVYLDCQLEKGDSSPVEKTEAKFEQLLQEYKKEEYICLTPDNVFE